MDVTVAWRSHCTVLKGISSEESSNKNEEKSPDTISPALEFSEENRDSLGTIVWTIYMDF